MSYTFRLQPIALHISSALACMVASATCVAQSDAASTLEKVVITGTSQSLPASDTAPSQGSLKARSAQSNVSDEFIRSYTSPVADYTQALAMTPGVFSYSPNGVGLGDSKITLRGLSDSFTVFSFDGIPFNDTNGVSHHSWVFFPSQFLGGATVDRSPGSAATVGQATFGGSVDFKSRTLQADRRSSVTASVGTWNTRLLGLEHETGQFGTDGKSALLVNVHEMRSDGYQTFNQQNRGAISAKFQTALTDKTNLTFFGSYLNLKNNTPNIKGVSRANHDAGNDTYLLSADPARADFYGYNFYDISTDFFYAAMTSDLGGGWNLEDKVYTYKYHNKQNYNGTTITTSSAIDKLNAYTVIGNLLRLTQTSASGVLRTGLWTDKAFSDRFQIPSDPRTGVNQSAPNFSESYTTTTLQPYVEYEFKVNDALKVTPGVKYASYKQNFIHLQDNGGAVGTLGGTFNKATGVITGGAPSLANAITYTDVLPSLDAHFQLSPSWTAYAQYAYGDQIPSTSVFDVKNAAVSPPPKPTKAKTAQIGTVWNGQRLVLAADIYRTRLDGAYTALPPDTAGNVAYVLSGTQINQGVEAEATLQLGSGFSLYANGTLGSLKYENGQKVAGAPRDTQSVFLNYQQGAWAASLSANRIGRMYGDAKDGTHEAFVIDPVVVANLFANYTVRSLPGVFKQAKLQLAVNNLFNRHSIVGIASPSTGSSSSKPLPTDLLTVLPARSLALTATLEF